MKIFRHFLGFVVAVATCSAMAAPLLSEGFNNIGTLGASGWVMKNNSAPPGTTGWFQGTPGVTFSAADGPADSYIAANFNNADFGGAISNWLITPELAMANGEKLNFDLRLLGEGFLDIVEVYMSTNGASTNVGSTASSTGDFTFLTSFGSTSDTGWVAQSLTVAGLGLPATGRFAFRYLVDNTAVNGDFIGIDSVSVDAAVPEPDSPALIVLALGALGLARRRTRRSAAGRFLAMLGLFIGAGAAYGAGQAAAQNGLMTFPNSGVINQPIVSPAPGATRQTAPEAGMKAFKDPVTGELMAPTAEQAAELEAAGKLATPSTSRKFLSVSQPTTIYPDQGGVGIVLDESQTSYFIVRKGADGKLIEECVPDQAAATKALQASRNSKNKAAVKGETK